MSVRTFSIGYFSEVSAVLSIREDCVIEATHPMDGVPISDWFHFGGRAPTDDPLTVGGDSVQKALSNMAYRLYPGVEMLLEETDAVEKPKEQFFTDFFIAFVVGEYYPASSNYPRAWTHRAGKWLLHEV